MGAKGLFRKSALEKLSSPERLDVMMQITSPAAWLALAALGAVLAALAEDGVQDLRRNGVLFGWAALLIG